MGQQFETPDIGAVDLTDDSYTVEQNLVRNKYRAYDADGNVVLRGKQKLFKMKEEFPFTDGDGNDAFTVKAAGFLDVAGNYAIIDAETGEEVVVLDNDFSIFRDNWRIRDADSGALVAKITSRGALVTLFRNLVPFGEWLPHKYEITDADGDHVGRIEGEFALKDRYQITIDDASDVPKEPIVAAAMVIDAIQGN
ncbi:LURP-one-related/scramblase family protein [Halobacteriales archaeon Cl-PHB]